MPLPRSVPYMSFWSSCVRRRRKPFIIGVTGSVGKSTTVAMIAAVLTQQAARAVIGNVGFTHHNMNSDRGLPQAILGYDNWPQSDALARRRLYAMPLRALKLMTFGRYPDVLVLEYGAGETAHMERSTRLAPPQIAVVTTIGPAHLEYFKTLEGVAQHKGLLVRAVPPGGVVVLGDNHELVDQLAAMSAAPVVKVPGRGLELAAGIARAIARHLAIPEEAVEAAVASFEPPKGRLRTWRLERFTVIDDSYNANPLSMTLGLETLSELALSPQGRRCLAVLGEMGELGEAAPDFHREIGIVAHRHADVIVGVGELARHYNPDRWYATSQDCAEAMGQLVEAGDCVLVKGSHALRMVRIVDQLTKIGGAAREEPRATSE